MHRSPNPDLLFPDVMKHRASVTAAWWCCHRGELPRDFDRFTVFVTHRCNLFCEYCTGPHMKGTRIPAARRKQMLLSDLTVESYERMLEDAVAGGAVISHVHFTGGEPTLHPELARMVEMTTKRNILSSITTNGTADPAVYRELVRRGLTEVRISIDSFDARKFDACVGVPGAFEKVLRGIREVVRLRDQEGRNVFLVLNACVGQGNLAETETCLRFLLKLAPDDIKFLVVVQDRDLVSAAQDEALKERLEALLSGYTADRFPLLRYKIGQLFFRDAVGLKDAEAQRLMEHCFLPLLERTFDGRHYYPCSIYTRYGDPLGSIAEPAGEQQRKTEEFVASHDCRRDPICVANCVNCCKSFNMDVNQNVQQFAGVLDVERPSQTDTCELSTALAAVRWDDGLIPGRFLIVKPLGMPHRDAVRAVLDEMQVPVVSKETIPEWSETFTAAFYGLMRTDVESTLVHSRAASQVESGPAEVWYLADGLSFERLGGVKAAIRERIPSRVYVVRTAGLPDRDRTFHMNAVHTPTDEDEARRQLGVIAHFRR